MNTRKVGYTLKEIIDGGRKVKREIDKTGKYPKGTTKSEWMFIGDIAVYCPYIPLFQTPQL